MRNASLVSVGAPSRRLTFVRLALARAPGLNRMTLRSLVLADRHADRSDDAIVDFC